MKKLVLAATFSAVLASGAIAQTGSNIPLRDPPFGKGTSENNTMNLPSSTGDAGRDDPESTPPRDPPFGKAELRNEPSPLPARSQAKAGEERKHAKLTNPANKNAGNKTASKKPGSGAKVEDAPKTDAD